jgi:ring-1,2-phenylacetyl-CoA epoxidase subunit PaaE
MNAATFHHRVPVFHRLAVRDVRADTDNALVVTFTVPAELQADYAWLPGQHVTLRMPGVDVDVRRSYSICSKPGDPLRVGIKRIDGGLFSTWAATSLRSLDEIDVMTPSGGFVIECDETATRHIVAVAAGAGITPLRSIVETILEREPLSRVTLLYANRSALDAMFLDELAELKDRFIQRFALWHVFTREGRDVDLLSGRVDATRVGELIARQVLPIDADAYYLCGPIGFVEQVRSALLDRGVPNRRTHVELFTSSTSSPLVTTARVDVDDLASTATIVLDGRSTTVAVSAGEAVLDAALRVRSEAPYSCRSGACSTCRALLRDGTVDMATTSGLEEDELAAGYVLTCQAMPTSATIVIDYDA